MGRQPGEPRGKVVLAPSSSLKAVSRAAGAIAILAGCSVLLGWALEIEGLKRVLPRLVAMNPMTAVAFVLASVSLLLIVGTEPADERLGRIGRGLALAVASVGLVKLVEALFVGDRG